MNLKTHYFVEILEKIGAPLLQSVIASSVSHSTDADIDQAQILAQLLSGTVQTSIAMGSDFNFVDMSDQGDSVRVALAALAAPLVAAQYAKNSTVPEQSELTKIVSVLESVLTFAENFKPSEENIQRLADVKANGKLVDGPQVDVQYMQAFLPVVQVVSGFSFGQPEKKLAMDVADRLVKRSVEFREQQFSTVLDTDTQKSIELVIVQSMARLYTECHQSVMNKLSAMADDTAAVPDIEAVWAEFDVRASILEVMMQNIIPDISAPQAAPISAPPLDAPVVADTPPVPEAVTEVAPDPSESGVSDDVSATPPVFQATPSIEPDEVLEPPVETPAIFSAAPSAPVEDIPPAVPSAEDVIEPEAVSNSIPQAAKEETSATAAVNPMAMFATPKEEKTEASLVQETASSPVTPPSDDGREEEEKKSGDAANPMSFFKSE